MMTTTEPQNKRSEELSETEIESLLNDVLAKLPLEVKKLIMSAAIAQETFQGSVLESYLKKQIENGSLNALDTYTGPLTGRHLHDLATRG